MIPFGVLGLGMPEMLLILLIVVFLFGARRIPEIARGLGEGIRGFRSSLRGAEDEERTESERRDKSAERSEP